MNTFRSARVSASRTLPRAEAGCCCSVDTEYDGAGRSVRETTKTHGTVRWSTRTTYTGDTAATTAPGGGEATAVVTDVFGRTAERREYGGTKPEGTGFTSTRYTYTPAGQQKTITGPDDAKWSYEYDLFGRSATATDPDAGATTTGYDTLDRPTSSTGAEGRRLLNEYDVLNRRTGLWKTEKTDADKLAAWTFDTLAKGQQATATRYDGGLSGKAYTAKVTKYSAQYEVESSQLLPADDEMVKAGVPQTLSRLPRRRHRLAGLPARGRRPSGRDRLVHLQRDRAAAHVQGHERLSAGRGLFPAGGSAPAHARHGRCELREEGVRQLRSPTGPGSTWRARPGTGCRCSTTAPARLRGGGRSAGAWKPNGTGERTHGCPPSPAYGVPSARRRQSRTR